MAGPSTPSAIYAYPSAPVRFLQYLSVRARITGWRIGMYLMTHPGFLRPVFGYLRRKRPIAIVFGVAIVTRHDDIVTVFKRNEDFILAEYAEERMLAGSFILNNDWPNQHDREDSAIRKAMRKSDVARVQRIARDSCDDFMRAHQGSNEINVVELAEAVALDVVKRYFGVPLADIDNHQISPWLIDLAGAILALPPQGSYARYETDANADKLTAFLANYIEIRTNELQAGTVTSDDTVLDRMIEMIPRNQQRRPVASAKGSGRQASKSAFGHWLNEDWVRRMIAGLIIFGAATIVRAATDAIYEILVRKDARKMAGTAADKMRASCKAGGGSFNGTEWVAMKKLVHEGLRFRPMLPILFRYSPGLTTIRNDEHDGRIISAGMPVVAPPIAAMFDDDVFDSPSEFRANRDLDHYLIYGGGMHKCIGQFVSDVELVEISTTVLSLSNVKLSNGKKPPVYSGVAAKKLSVSFD